MDTPLIAKDHAELRLGDSFCLEVWHDNGFTRETVTLIAGIINDAAIDAYSYGHCWSLALALHGLTGWPLVFLGRPVCDPDSKFPHFLAGDVCGCQLWHLVVMADDGRILDIQGLTLPVNLEETLSRQGLRTFPATTEMLRAMVSSPTAVAQNLPAARIFATAIVSQAAI